MTETLAPVDRWSAPPFPWDDSSEPAWLLRGEFPVFEDPPMAAWVAPGVEVAPPSHALLETVGAVRRQLACAAEVGVAGLTAGEVREAVARTHGLVAQAQALLAQLATQADKIGLPASNGSPSAAVWLAHETKLTRRDAHRLVRLGSAVGSPAPSSAAGPGADAAAGPAASVDTSADADPAADPAADTGATAGSLPADVVGAVGTGRYGLHLAPAFTSGRVNVEQADVIVGALDALDGLPDDVPVEVLREAEQTLVLLARDHDARDLRALGKKILTVVAPEIGEAVDAAALEREERDARATARFSMVSDGHGSVHGRFRIPELHAAMLTKALDAYAAHGHKNTATDPAERFTPQRPSPERLGDAFCLLLEGLQDRDLPDTGGTGATVVVTMTLDSLLGGLAPAALDTGASLSAAEARRLACEAGIIPAVLGTKSEPLDLGRSTRFHTKAQRLAIALRDNGCATEGCTRPPHHCHIHHIIWWSRGGPTDLRHAAMLCPHHHQKAHDPRYTIETLGTGKLRFILRT